MISLSYRGMTVNVTYKFLTGGNMNYFSLGYIPFIQLYKDTNFSPSITNNLKNNGYQCSIILRENSYSSGKIYSMLEFKNYQKLDNTNKQYLKWPYFSDEYIGNITIENLEKSNK